LQKKTKSGSITHTSGNNNLQRLLLQLFVEPDDGLLHLRELLQAALLDLLKFSYVLLKIKKEKTFK